MNLLYIGIRCNDKDVDGSAWNHHKENLNYIFNTLNYKVEYLKLGNLKDLKLNSLFNILNFFKQIIKRKRVIPLQEMIYLFKFYNNYKKLNFKDIIQKKNFDVIFLESSRLTFILEEIQSLINIKKKFIVCDMDDLLSKRYSFIKKNNNAISFGHETKSLFLFNKLINLYSIKHLFLTYEISALLNSERKLKLLCNSISLVSKKEVQYLKASKGSCKAYIAHTYSFDPYCDIKNSFNFNQVERFIFIGSDRQIQNKSSIENLLKIWSDKKINYDLYIYGRLFNHYEICNNKIHIKGYVKDLSKCYKRNSVLINLTEIEGGIKIKTIQAISRGIPVIGLQYAFDGLPLNVDLLKFKDISQVKSLIKSKNINSYLKNQYLAQNKIARNILTKESVLLNWESILCSK